MGKQRTGIGLAKVSPGGVEPRRPTPAPRPGGPTRGTPAGELCTKPAANICCRPLPDQRFL